MLLNILQCTHQFPSTVDSSSQNNGGQSTEIEKLVLIHILSAEVASILYFSVLLTEVGLIIRKTHSPGNLIKSNWNWIENGQKSIKRHFTKRHI